MKQKILNRALVEVNFQKKDLSRAFQPLPRN